MKQYIKPQTEITIVKARTAMLQASETQSINNSVSNSSQMTKERDVWSDGFWD
jgi:hypothetical protein